MPKVIRKFKSVLAAPPKPKQQKQQQQQQQNGKQQQKQKHRTQPYNTNSSSRTHHQQRSVGWWNCASVIDQQSAEVLEKLLLAAETRRGGATIKSLTLAPHIVHKKPTFAVTCETLKHLPLLKQLVADAGLLDEHADQLSPAAAYVLVYEVLFGQGLRRKGPAEKAVLQQKDRLKAGLQELLQHAGVQDAAGWLQLSQPQQHHQEHHPAVQHPRHARVNTLKCSVQQVLSQLQQQQEQEGGTTSRNLSVHVDELLPDLLVFPPGTDLHDHPLVTSGVLILQSKASCMPAHALQPQPGWHVVDCCAAPGNKTTHAAALLHANTAAAAGASSFTDAASKRSKGKRSRLEAEGEAGQQQPAGAGVAAAGGGDVIKVFAFDKDPKRLKRLAANVQKAGAERIVVAQQADFLSIDPQDPLFSQVKGVILDPSCSGSGTTVSRMDHLLPSSSTAGGDDTGGGDAREQQRVEQLAKFQETALLHAITFPALQRLVYSTCSIHQRENEDVVAAVLPAATAAGFRLVDPFPAWKRRGLPVVPGSELLVRTDAHEDGTDGFFVAVFERHGAANPAAAAATIEAEQQQEQLAHNPGPAKHKRKKKKKLPQD